MVCFTYSNHIMFHPQNEEYYVLPSSAYPQHTHDTY